jgi:WD40 repeat protein
MEKIISDQEETLDDLVVKARNDANLKKIIHGKNESSSISFIKCEHYEPVFDVCADGNLIALANEEGFRVLEYSEPGKSKVLLHNGSKSGISYRYIAISASRKYVAAVSGMTNLGCYEIYDNGKPYVFNFKNVDLENSISSIAFTPYNPDFCIAAGNKYYTYHFSKEDLVLKHVPIEAHKEISAIAIGRHDYRAAAIGNVVYAEVAALNAGFRKGTPIYFQNGRPVSRILSMDFSDDGNYLAVVAAGEKQKPGSLTIYKTRFRSSNKLELEWVASREEENLLGISFCSDNKHLVGCSALSGLLWYEVK